MRILYLNCTSGVSGERILSALVNAGAGPQAILERLWPTTNAPFELQVIRSAGGGLNVSLRPTATAGMGEVGEDGAFIQQLPLCFCTGRILLATLNRLETARAAHGELEPTLQVHELWILAAIGAALDLLEVEEIRASSIGVGMAGESNLSFVPQPLLMRLSEGLTIHVVPCGADLSTPIGLAFLASAIRRFGPLPSMQLVAYGSGAGLKEWPVPNILQVFIGEVSAAQEADRVAVVETNIDDMPVQAFDHVMGLLFAESALDVFFTPIGMKKNRPATMLSVICTDEALEKCIGVILRETTTLGVRITYADRRVLARKFLTVETVYGPVSVKAALLNGGVRSITPEYDNCHTLALQASVPLRTVQDAATEAAWAALWQDGWKGMGEE